jgi:hypothetical protein
MLSSEMAHVKLSRQVPGLNLTLVDTRLNDARAEDPLRENQGLRIQCVARMRARTGSLRHCAFGNDGDKRYLGCGTIRI